MSEGRLFQILYHLLYKGETTASELANKFEVSTRTIYRDIDKLSGAGIPVYTTTGYRGGIHLDDTFVLNKSLLSENDIQSILMGTESLSAISFSSSTEVISKLQALFKIDSANWMQVDYSRWGCSAKKEQHTFALLKEAIQNKYQVHFKYYNSKGEASNRICNPLKLIFKDRAWYLYAHCLVRNNGRLFRISRIRELELTDQSFENIQNHEEPNIFSSLTGPLIEMELAFSKKSAYRIYDIFDEEVITTAKDCLIVKTSMPEDEWLFSFLMSFGDELTILSPLALKDKLIKRYKAALKHFET